MQEEYREKDKKLYMCFVDLEKAFDRVPKRVMQLALRKKGLPEILVKAVMSLYEVQKRRLKLDLNSQKNFMWRLLYIRNLFCHLCCLQLWWML